MVEKIFRWFLWLTVGTQNRFKTASHRQHHRYSDRPGDPHSWHQLGFFSIGIRRVLVGCAVLLFFLSLAKNANENYPNEYGVKHIDDFTNRYPRLGRAIFLLALIWAFGISGLLFWVCYIVTVVILAFFVGDTLFHAVGYRNHDLKDHSHNHFFLLGLVGGEEYHNNHHARPYSANFANRWYEIDIGYFYIKLLEKINLAKIRSQ